MVINTNRILTALLSLSLYSVGAHATDNLLFKGNLIIPNCTVNNNQSIETDFGDIEIQTLSAANTGYHWKSIQIPVDCPYNYGTPKINLTGQQGVSTNSIQTSKYNTEKLVIYLQQGTPDKQGKKINLGSYQELEQDAIVNTNGNQKNILITASVGREQGMELLTPGPFTASVNMEMRYE
ncbi:fimbrial protein [Escherichia coli]|uniref:fimbrial protein n=1 Tax=Escherichia coli TaxID=562 RepID=UPI0021D285C8|nr:fimbrial protein [Escherichia coli]MCU6345186.1 fimbrial protein [Escherichia coli]